MLIYGTLPETLYGALLALVDQTEGLLVRRKHSARSLKSFPKSTDLEDALKHMMIEAGFLHHHRLCHPQTNEGFEYDFWHPGEQLAMEIMGYRADDEVYKNLLKFHVHQETKVGVVWVPRYKWISGKRTDTNYKATKKAVEFADSYMNVKALVVLPYDWSEKEGEGEGWLLHHTKEE